MSQGNTNTQAVPFEQIGVPTRGRTVSQHFSCSIIYDAPRSPPLFPKEKVGRCFSQSSGSTSRGGKNSMHDDVSLVSNAHASKRVRARRSTAAQLQRNLHRVTVRREARREYRAWKQELKQQVYTEQGYVGRSGDPSQHHTTLTQSLDGSTLPQQTTLHRYFTTITHDSHPASSRPRSNTLLNLSSSPASSSASATDQLHSHINTTPTSTDHSALPTQLDSTTTSTQDYSTLPTQTTSTTPTTTATATSTTTPLSTAAQKKMTRAANLRDKFPGKSSRLKALLKPKTTTAPTPHTPNHQRLQPRLQLPHNPHTITQHHIPTPKTTQPTTTHPP